MKRQNSRTTRPRVSRPSSRVSRDRVARRSRQAKSNRRSPRLSARQQEAKLRCLAAINRVRQGQSKSVSAAVRAEETTLTAIHELVPDAITQDRPGKRIRVKKSDRYSAKVEVMTNEGRRVVTARGSRQRELAGQHRATFMRVLQGKEPPSALKRYRRKKIGEFELISDYELLRTYAEAGEVGQLETLYVSPDTSA